MSLLRPDLVFKTAGRIAKRMGNSLQCLLREVFFQIQYISQSSTQGAIFNQKIDRYFFPQNHVLGYFSVEAHH